MDELQGIELENISERLEQAGIESEDGITAATLEEVTDNKGEE
ncbi:hypothetical protein FACS1894111_05510 [Clostridia bacterium]|nr:hypothetical protein FACS1894111_05510 [Clostridia bacterium]